MCKVNIVNNGQKMTMFSIFGIKITLKGFFCQKWLYSVRLGVLKYSTLPFSNIGQTQKPSLHCMATRGHRQFFSKKHSKQYFSKRQ